MMQRYLKKQIQQRYDHWKNSFENRNIPEDVDDYQKQIKLDFIDSFGGLPEKCDLNPVITGELELDEVRLQKIIIESQPNHFVTASLFLPNADKYVGQYPVVLIPCGHMVVGKAEELYQKSAMLLAHNGIAAMIFDPIDQGQRSQLLTENAEPVIASCTQAHTMIGVGSVLLGQNTARFEIWDAMRCVDYLQSRDDIDSEKIGCAGNSGGGTQTAYLMALDDRIKVAAPSSYITDIHEMVADGEAQDAEQMFFAQFEFEMGHADFLLMAAPKPILLCCNTHDFFDIAGSWKIYRYVKRFYSLMGYAHHVDIVESDTPHGWNPLLREAMVRWMVRWLIGNDTEILKPELNVFKEEQLQCGEFKQIMQAKQAVSTYDLNRQTQKKLAEKRRKLWQETNETQLVSKICQLANMRQVDELDCPKVKEAETKKCDGYSLCEIEIVTEMQIVLEADLYQPERKAAGGVLYIHAEGRKIDAAKIEKIVKSGKIVLAVELRGTAGNRFEGHYLKADLGLDIELYYAAYVIGKSYVGMRAEDILVCSKYLKQLAGNIELISIGYVGIASLHAAAANKQLFDKVTIRNCIRTWAEIIELGKTFDQMMSTIHGALRVYDLDNLADMIGSKLTIEKPLDPMGVEIK